ncbi:MAG: hypothetical protein EBZ74_04375 [Planctomycetia bacterium]|nr:hypothetical protein [Planctomycetia bacterium]
MSMHRVRFVLACAVHLALAAAASAGDLGRLVDGLAAPFRALHRSRPETCADDEIERLGAEIEWLERQINLHGSIVAKAPDVWGQNRLVRHRLEYEEQLRRQLPLFEQHSQAAIRRSDQSFLGLALAVQSASGRRRPAEFVAAPDASVVNSIQTLLPTTNEQVGRADPVVIARTAPFAGPPLAPGMRFDEAPLALEPTLQLDHLSRYLGHLHELRRINEGDDSADAPGYALDLLRIPVSIVPGGKTQKGHGAEITITVDPRLDDDLLPNTVRDLVINDLVDLVAPALTHCVNDPDCVAWADTILAPAEAGGERAGVMAAMRSLAERLPAITPATAPSMKTRRSRLPIPVSQLAEVAGIRQIALLVQAARRALAAHPAARPCIEYVDVRGFLADELAAAADLLALDRHRGLWAALPGWRLAELVRGRRADDLAAVRCQVLALFGTGSADPPPEPLPAPPAAGVCCEDREAAPPFCTTPAAALAWGILVESALLDERLAADIRATSGGAACPGPLVGPDPAPEARAAFNDYVRRRWPVRVFALDPAVDEQTVDDAFARRRELQIATAAAFASGRLNAQGLARYTRRVEADLSVVALNRTVVGFAHGADTFGWRFMPRVQTPPTRGQLATLGETLCGPSAAADLASRGLEPGIRECVAIVVMPSFVPRLVCDVHTRWFSLAHPAATEPDMRHTLRLSRSVKALERTAAACGRCEHLYRDGQMARLMRRVEQLEERLPQQTLEARVPHENTCGGFELFDSGVTDLAPELVGWYGAPGVDRAAGTTLFLIGKGFSVHDTRVIAGGRPARFRLLSREVLEVEIPPGVQTIGRSGCGACDLELHQREARGSANARRALGRRGPREELSRRWNAGLTSAAAPEPAWASPASHAEPLPAPAHAPALEADAFPCHEREFVDVHLATPYGVTSHLLVPVSTRGNAAAECGLAFADAGTLRLSFTVSKAAGGRTEAARVDEFFALDADRIVITAPAVFVPPAKGALQLLVRDESSGATAAELSFEPLAFDARENAYVIAGGDLRNLVGDTSRPATDKTLRGAIKPYLDSLLARGDLADDGATLPFTLSAVLVADGRRVPVGGAIPVAVSRRGKTVAEPETVSSGP